MTRQLSLRACQVDLETGALSGGRSGRLTTRELDLLRFLADHAGSPVAREVLTRDVFGYRAGARTRAVDKAMSQLRAKVEADPGAPEHLISVQGLGYRFVASSPPQGGRVRAPTPSPALVGRGPELEQLARALAAPGRLVTVTGLGGIGKSTVAAEIARRVQTQQGPERNSRLTPGTPGIAEGSHREPPAPAEDGRQKAIFEARAKLSQGPERNSRLTLGTPGIAEGSRHEPPAPAEDERQKAIFGARASSLQGHEVFRCVLTAARTEDDLIHALAAALDVSALGGADGVGASLDGRSDALVVLDGFEHLIACAPLVDRWRSHAPRTRWLVTSRQRLGLRDEHVLVIEPLAHPDAVELFTRCAAARGCDVAADPAVDPLVRGLEGIPLALELAAGRLRILAPADLAARLGDRLELLRGRDGGDPRLTTLRGTLDWSWDLLDDRSRTALAGLAVFRGSFTLEAAERVLGHTAEGSRRVAVDDLLESLLDASLLHWRATPGGVRLVLLDTVRAYARERLDADPLRAREAADRHAACFARWGDPSTLVAIAPSDARWRRLVDDYDNLVAACRHALASGDADTAAATCLAAWAAVARTGPWTLVAELAGAVRALPGLASLSAARLALILGAERLQAEPREARAHFAAAFEGASAAPTSPASRLVACQAARSLARAAMYVGDRAGADLALDRATALVDPGDRVERAMILRERAAVARDGGAFTDAIDHCRAGLELLDPAEAPYPHALLLGALGLFQSEAGDLDGAAATLERAVTLLEHTGDATTSLVARGNLGVVAAERGDLATAVAVHRRCIADARRLGHRRGEAGWRLNLTEYLVQQGALDEAEPCAEAAEHVARALGDPKLQAGAAQARARVALARGRPRDALAWFAQADTALAAIGAHAERVAVACGRVEAHLLLGDVAEAEAWGAAAAEHLSRTAAGPESGPGRQLARAQERLRRA